MPLDQSAAAMVLAVPPSCHGKRLDSFLSSAAPEHSRSEWQRLIEAQAVTVEGRTARQGLRLVAGDTVRVAHVPSHLALEADATIPLKVIYEDDATIIVDKQAGLVVHPAPGHQSGTLVNALLARYPSLRDPSGALRPGIVHRLDKDTSGLMVVGKTASAVSHLQQQMKARKVEKAYLVLVRGTIAEDRGIIIAPISRSPADRQRMAVGAGGKEAETEFTVRQRFGDSTLVEARPRSGRTHQLRVHFAYIGHPVAGDRVYGPGRSIEGLSRHFVHASYLALTSPATGQWLEFRSPLPEDLARVVDLLGRAPLAVHDPAPRSRTKASQ